MRHHYVYYSYEEWGKGYIGVRSCDCRPEDDGAYFGSFTDANFRPTQKLILQEFATRKEAGDAEITLHTFYDIAKNPHFANKAKHTSNGFCREGVPQSNKTRQKQSKARIGKKQSKETCEKISNAVSDENHPLFGVRGENHPLFGRSQSDGHKQKNRDAHLGKKMSEETCQKHAKEGFGRKWWVNSCNERKWQREKPEGEWQQGWKWKEV